MTQVPIGDGYRSWCNEWVSGGGFFEGPPEDMGAPIMVLAGPIQASLIPLPCVRIPKDMGMVWGLSCIPLLGVPCPWGGP